MASYHEVYGNLKEVSGDDVAEYSNIPDEEKKRLKEEVFQRLKQFDLRTVSYIMFPSRAVVEERRTVLGMPQIAKRVDVFTEQFLPETLREALKSRGVDRSFSLAPAPAIGSGYPRICVSFDH
jgi:hypothetical protein